MVAELLVVLMLGGNTEVRSPSPGLSLGLGALSLAYSGAGTKLALIIGYDMCILLGPVVDVRLGAGVPG